MTVEKLSDEDKIQLIENYINSIEKQNQSLKDSIEIYINTIENRNKYIKSLETQIKLLEKIIEYRK
jgi:exonuclease VII small subunit